MNRQLLGFAALAAFIAAGAAPASADMFARINGRVTRDDSKNGLRTVVTISDGSGRTFDVSTDRDGRFSAIGLQPGDLSVSLNVEGVKQVEFTCTIPAGETGRFELGAFPDPAPRLLNTNSVHNWTMKAEHDGCTLEPSTVDQYVIQ